MENANNQTTSRFQWKGDGERLVVRIQPIDVSCDGILSALIDTVLILVERKNTRIVDVVDHAMLASYVFAQMLRLRKQLNEVQIQISNASPHIIRQLEATKLDTLIHILRE
jgi:hypothetical protein